jgi:hypothetical protein
MKYGHALILMTFRKQEIKHEKYEWPAIRTSEINVLGCVNHLGKLCISLIYSSLHLTHCIHTQTELRVPLSARGTDYPSSHKWLLIGGKKTEPGYNTEYEFTIIYKNRKHKSGRKVA